MSQSLNPEAVLAELTEVRRRLADAEELIRALRQEEADALVRRSPLGDEVYPRVHNPRLPAEFQQSLLDTIPTPVYYKGLEGELLGCNQALADLVGRPKEEIINQKVSDLFPPELAVAYRQKDKELIIQGGIQEYESEANFGDGERHLIIARKSLFYQQDGSIGGIIGVITDITERRRAETERERLAAIVTGSDDAILGKTLEGIITNWNPAAERLYGYSAAEIIGKSIMVLVPPEYHAEMETILQEVKRGTGVEHLRTLRRRQDGTLVEVSLTVSPIKDGKGRIIGASVITRDITEILKKERQLKASEERYRLLVEQIPAVVFKGYADWSLDFFDDKIEDFTGYPKADFDSRRLHWNELILPEDLHEAQEKFLEALRGDKSYVREYRIRRRDGEIVWVQGRSQLFLDEAGRIAYVSGVLFDITAQKRAQNQINDLNTLLKAIKEINEALLRVKTEPELFQQTCALLLKAPHIQFTWIGLLQPESPEIKVVAHAGHEQGYIANMKLTWDDTEWGQGPTGEAIRTRAPIVIKDMATDSRVAPWRAEALKQGFRSNVALPLVHQEEVLGVLKAYSSEPDGFGPEELEFLNQVAGDIVVGVKSLRVEQEMIQALIQLRVVLQQTVEAIGTIAEYRDPYTAGHQRQVTSLACAIAAEMGLERARIEGLKVAGFLHDLGKITIPAEILSRPGKLNSHEQTIMRTHVEASFDIVKKISFPWPVAEIVRQHHERLNGSGYPRGLVGEKILLEARILAVADVVEAISSHRPYRPALGIEAALEEITKNKGVLYDPEVVNSCIRVFKEKGFQFT